jgi:hypothetical protein
VWDSSCLAKRSKTGGLESIRVAAAKLTNQLHIAVNKIDAIF